MESKTPLIFITDTREQKEYSFPIPALRRKLNAGDYSVQGLEERVAVERKSLPDFVRTVIRDRDRFHEELRKLAQYEFACVVVEATLQDVLEGKYPGYAHPNAVLGAAVSISVDWGIPVFFCGDRQSSCRLTEEFLKRCHTKLNSRP